MKHTFVTFLLGIILLFVLHSVSNAQDFIWVPHGQESQHPAFSRVIGGKLNDGTELPICRAVINGFQIPGKFYNSSCIMPWNGKEQSNRATYDIFMTRVAQHWKGFHDLSRAQVEASAIRAGAGQKDTGWQGFCRHQMQDGLHPGKFATGNSLCYISWGGKEYHFNDGFDILVQ